MIGMAQFQFLLGLGFTWAFTISLKGFLSTLDKLKSDIRSYNASRGIGQSLSLNKFLKTYYGLPTGDEVEKLLEDKELSYKEYIKGVRHEIGILNLYNTHLVLHITTVLWLFQGLLQFVNSLPVEPVFYLLTMLALLVLDTASFLLVRNA